MLGKKLPLKQPPPQVYEQQYSQQQSEPLIEQVDPSYEPNEKEVREYAIETLGMKLPEDENLLYLAREGLKAPITTNWVPYQSRNGEIYYKHNITQEKTYDHPTDTEYRKKYEQIKEKAARKNLKSIAMKQNLSMQGLLPNNNSLASGLGLINSSGGLVGANNSGLGGGISNLSGFSAGAEEPIQPTLDEQLLQQYETDLAEYEKKQEKEWRGWQQQAEEEHQKRMKKIKQEHEEQKSRLQGKSSKKTSSRILEQQQAKLEQQLQESQQSTLNQELRVLEKEEENKLDEYKAVYEEDNKLKIKKLEQELQHNYQEKTRMLQQKIRKAQQRKIKQKQHRLKILKQTKQELQKPNNPEIAKLLHNTLEQNLNTIKQEYSKKLKQKQAELEHQLQQMRKVLGVDKSQNLLILAAKKEKLLSLSKLKVTAKRNTEVQVIETEIQKQLESEKLRLREKLEKECEDKKQNKRKELDQKYAKIKKQLETDLVQRTQRKIAQMYENSTAEKNNYQAMMNKKMSQLRMQYINQIANPKKGDNGNEEKIVSRVMIQEKQSQIANKEELVKNLERQLELQRQQWKILLFQEEICKRIGGQNGDKNKQVSSYLKQKIKQMAITYKPPELVRFLDNFNSLQNQYKDDKRFLGKILKGIQDTSAYNLYEMRKNSLDGEGSNPGSGALVKRYNQDVRKMRDNEDMLNKFELLIKKAQLGGEVEGQNLQNLRNFVARQLKYHEITLKAELEKNTASYPVRNPRHQNLGSQSPSHKLQQYQPSKQNEQGTRPYAQQQPWLANYSTPTSTMEQALRQHSQFLSDVKNQLNRKLYQVRYEHRY